METEVDGEKREKERTVKNMRKGRRGRERDDGNYNCSLLEKRVN